MTVTSTTSTQPYAGDGVTVAFSIPFPFFSSGDSPELFPDVEVYLRVISTGAETLQVITTHYTIAIDAGTEPQQGDVTMVTAPTIDQELHIVRSTALTQATAFTVGGPFPAVEHEKALDRAALRTIDQAATLDRGLRFPRTDPESISAEIPSSVDRASKYLAFSSTGAIIVNESPTDTTLVSDFMEDVLASSTEGEAKTLLEIEDMNLLYNPCFEVVQRGGYASGNNPADLEYTADGWKFFTSAANTATVDFVAGSTLPASTRTQLSALSLGAGKWFTGQIFENTQTTLLVKSGGIEIAFDLFVSALTHSLHMYVLKWTGASDAPTADPVNVWGADGVTPTFVANWELVTEQVLTQTTILTYQRQAFTVTGGISDAVNIAICIGPGTDDPTAAHLLRATNFACVPLNGSTYMLQPSWENTFRRCQRTYWSTFPITSTLGNHGVADDNEGLDGAIRFAATEGGDPNFARDIRNPVPMLKAPTHTFFNPLTGTAAQAHNVTDTSTTAVDAEDVTADSARIGPTATDATDDGDDMALHMTVKVEL
ncbi:MAG: hypothetical protein V3V08_23595 [Nannocystaceae bacterium]